MQISCAVDKIINEYWAKQVITSEKEEKLHDLLKSVHSLLGTIGVTHVDVMPKGEIISSDACINTLRTLKSSTARNFATA